MRKFIMSTLLFTLLATTANAAFKKVYNQATVNFDDITVSIVTGKIKASFILDQGLMLTSLIDHKGVDWVKSPQDILNLDGIVTSPDAKVLGVTCTESDDQGFTSKHLKVLVELEYDSVFANYEIWVYPGAEGIRTVLALKAKTGVKITDLTNKDNSSASFSIDFEDCKLKAFGYYSDTQNRNKANTPIIKEEQGEFSAEMSENSWANGIIANCDGSAFLLVKESHKCVNTKHNGANCGVFKYSDDQIISTGLGLSNKEITSERFRDCWAHWIIVSEESELSASTALKQFDRLRYPIDPKRDIYIMANTWGSTNSPIDGRYAAREENVLKEIASQADLGLDVQQIDDGWQGNSFRGLKEWNPVKTTKYSRGKKLPKKSDYDVYPEGWKNVVTLAKEKNLRLGLWAAWWIPEQDLIRQYDAAGFTNFKLDFAHLTTMTKVDSLMSKARNLILHSGHKCRINWDVTEKEPRVGYFYGREYGNIYLENRKPMTPASVVYKPWLVLRDAWHVAKYVNLNKFQITYQNNDMINRKVSDAWKHDHGYTFMQTIMGSPIFFQETQFIKPAARERLKPLISLYKKHRQEMFKGYVYPVGDEPTNAAWSGFQNVVNEKSGYLTVFRQIENKQENYQLKLNFLAGKSLELTNLVANETSSVVVNKDGELTLKLDQPGSFLFLKYKVK